MLYIGGSTCEGVVSTNYLPGQADRENAQLRDVGVTDFVPEISGARATVEHYKGEPSGMDIVDKYVAQGFRTLVSSSPTAESNMRTWNDALTQAWSGNIARATSIGFPAKGGPPSNCLVSSH